MSKNYGIKSKIPMDTMKGYSKTWHTSQEELVRFG